ncbi:response regulator transcription factor [Flagellimonas algicola]|uniref:Response regulator transcription factor n=2 Tax=Flagellimonas algicola TaxID=2583815 RepID=A0ABY2WN17_9FLAO|nr:response regulator transcription factor [Allomuricauda algicola]
MGAHHAYIKGENIDVAYDPDTDQVTTTGEITYGNDVSNSEGNTLDFSQLNNSSGLGADIGFIYEWRPDHAQFKSTNNDGKSLTNKGANKYKLKFGVSVTDIGKINNKEGEQVIYDLNKIQDYANFEGADLEDALQGNFDVAQELNSTAKTSLPTASNVSEAVKVLSVVSPDVVFLDIELQTGQGFDVLNQIKDPNFEVIFTTAFEKYAIKAIKFSSLDYLLKPIDLDELKQAVEKARNRMDTNVYREQIDTLMQNLSKETYRQEKICLATTIGMEFIKIEDIVLCKADGSYTSFVLRNKSKLMVSKHLKEYEHLLAEHQFMRVHNSFVINLREVKKYIKADGGYIIMSNDMHVSLSPRKKDELIEALKKL